jgi:anti-sigma B factor antagonist
MQAKDCPPKQRVITSPPLMSVQILTLTGEIDLNEQSNIALQLDPLIERESPAILIDLAEVSYVDSSGLALFIDALQRVQKYGGKMALSALSENVKMVFEIAKLDQIFQLFSTREAAIEAMSLEGE